MRALFSVVCSAQEDTNSKDVRISAEYDGHKHHRHGHGPHAHASHGDAWCIQSHHWLNVAFPVASLELMCSDASIRRNLVRLGRLEGRKPKSACSLSLVRCNARLFRALLRATARDQYDARLCNYIFSKNNPESYFLLTAICSGSLCQSCRNYETRQRAQPDLDKKTHQ